jgi:hypothetical protein
LEPARKTCETVMGTDYIHTYKHHMNDFYAQLQIWRWYNTFKAGKFNAVGISAVTACSEFDSGQVTCDGHKLDFRLLIRFICKERGLS